ncbi:MAG: tRNA 2-thiouridine(34) synthase MnmA [Actinobacteria bacterium]|nr:tRNA 2-thiouridine(34) synthase MnmA [Actinomycetota bacterium]
MTHAQDHDPFPRAYGPRVLEHLRAPRGVGTLESPDATGSAGSRTCGDLVVMHAHLRDGRIVEARFQAFGCPATIASAAEIVRRLPRMTIVEAAALGHEWIAEHLELPPHKRGCSEVAADALHNLLEDWVGSGLPLRPDGREGTYGFLVAMSGGVDSSVAALRLKETGRPVTGVTFRLWADPTCSVSSGCCSPETVRSARRTAHHLGLPHLTVDLTDRFFDEVVEHFVAEYAAGRTPNPCVSCNSVLRFDALIELADRLGASHVATGHYARMMGRPPRLHRGVDVDKDQSYVLSRVDPHLLERVVFPLGDLVKSDVRRLARQAGLEAHDAEESQEICFIPDDDYRRFLADRLGRRVGAIVDGRGVILGSHDGTFRFTIGQRKGLGISSPEPLYVTAIGAADGTVVVGTRDDLRVTEVRLGHVVEHRERGRGPLTAQLRSSGGVVAVEIGSDTHDPVLKLATHGLGVALGQTGVVYEADAVLLAGSIEGTR